MAIDSVLEQPGYPVNELGEVVVQVGVGTSNVVGMLPASLKPVDSVSGKMVVRLPDSVATFETNGVGVVTGLDGTGGFAFKSARRQFRHRLGGNLVASTSGAVTRHATYTLPSGFVAWKVRCLNNGAVSIPNHLVSVAASANATSPYTPTGSWVTALFSGVAAHTIPGATVLDANNFVPGQIESDVMFTASTARNDSGAGSIIMLRNVIPSGAPATNPRIDAHATPLFPANGIAAYFKAGVDAITSPELFVTPSGALTFPPVEFIGYTENSVRRLHFIGSSTFAGQGDDTAGRHGFGWIEDTKNTLNSGLPSTVYATSCNAKPGCSTAWTAKKIAGDLTMDGIDACAYATYSTNDTDRETQAGMDRVIGQTVYFIDECRKNGVLPILSTFQAVTGDTGTYHLNRQAVNARVRAIATFYDLPVLDFELWLSSMGSIGAWLNPSFTTDGLHPNSAGHAYIATLAAPVIYAALS
jgi:hypothetical protein